MDTSKQYIEMCAAAQEIQKMKEEQSFSYNHKMFNVGDHMCYEDRCYVIGDRQDAPTKAIWLPKQDQLSEMIETWNKKYSWAFFENIVANSSYRGIPKQGFDSIEKHLLVFLMADKYSKLWDEKQKVWYDNDNVPSFYINENGCEL